MPQCRSNPLVAFFLVFAAIAVGRARTATVTPTSLTFPTTAVSESSNPKPVVLENTGTSSINITSIAISGDYKQTTNCGASLKGDASCIIYVTFVPTVMGTRNGTLKISGDVPFAAPLTGTAVPPITIFPVSVSFASQVVSTSANEVVITIHNRLAKPLAIGNFAVNGDFTQVNSCFGALPALGTCYVQVGFVPSATGKHNGAVTFNYGTSNTHASISLTGTGVAKSLTSIYLKPYLPSMPIGTAQPFSATGSFTGGIIQDVTASCSWTSSDTEIATVHGMGMVTAVAPGTATITATSGDISGSVKLTVVDNLVVLPRNATVRFTGTVQFQATAPDNGTGFTWSVDGVPRGSAGTGTISSSGLYTAPHAVGTHIVSARAAGGLRATATVYVSNGAGVYTWHNDVGRTGQQRAETVLTPANVNVSQFGRVFTYPVDGQIYAQPLYVPGVNISGYGWMNVVYVATQHDSIYAFDADGRVTQPLWKVSFINPSAGIIPVPYAELNNPSIQPENGITGTPVIDAASGTMYVCPYTRENGVYYYRLHALDITTGADKVTPAVISATYPGKGDGTDGHGNVVFSALKHRQRPALLLSNGVVDVAFASQYDHHPAHGWLLGYDATSLEQVSVYNTTPNTSLGSLWGSGAGPAADPLGNIYIMSANGPFDGVTEFGDSFIKLAPGDGNLTPADFFTPFNQATLNAEDIDLGSGGVMVLPQQPVSPANLITGMGKECRVYLVDQDSMGHFNASGDTQIVQSFDISKGECLATPAFWNNSDTDNSGIAYYQGGNTTLKAYQLVDGQLKLVASGSTAGFGGATLSISSNGSKNGIVWLLEVNDVLQGGDVLLRAFDASKIAKQIYNSNQAAGRRDVPGPSVKFTPPTIADGKVFVPTANALSIYSLLP